MESEERPNVELLKWLGADEWKHRDRGPIGKLYESFQDAAEAIDKHGPLEIETDRANLYFFRTSGRFERGIVAVRQSGLNVRRIYIDPNTFSDMYGSFESCVNHLLSNNAVGPEVELAHVRDFADALNLDTQSFDENRRFERDEVDAIACLQMVEVLEDYVSQYPDDERFLSFLFSVGFTAGRAFSSLQAAVTLEAGARNALETRRKNLEKGRKGGAASRKVKAQNIEAFWLEIEALSDLFPRISEQAIFAQAYKNAAMKRKMPKSPKTVEAYEATIRSESPYKERFDAVFRKKA